RRDRQHRSREGPMIVAGNAPPRERVAPADRRWRKWAWLGASAGLPLVGAVWALALGPLLPGKLAGTFTRGVLAAVLAVCVVTDLARHKIYNWITYPAFLWALAVNAVASLAGNPPAWAARLGTVGLGSALAGGVACFILLMIVYELSGYRGA